MLQEDGQREAFSKKISELMNKMLQNYLPIDAACDQMGRKYIHDSMPPMITEGTLSVTHCILGYKMASLNKFSAFNPRPAE